jgi:carbonic anhydrase/acetyltransferase-like protein (isoleucine patch superfamily)
MPCYSLDGTSPQIDRHGSWVAPDAVLVGKVEVGAEVGIWFGVIARGDNEPIFIGSRSNVQENTVLHTDLGYPLTIGTGCTIGHKAILHGCSIGDNTLIGMGATVLNGARIGSNCLIGAGALITEGKIIPDGSLVIGMPGNVIRPLSEDEIASLRRSADGYVRNARRFASGLERISSTLPFDPA